MCKQFPESLNECIQSGFEFFEGGLVLVCPTEQTNDFNRRAELVKRLAQAFGVVDVVRKHYRLVEAVGRLEEFRDLFATRAVRCSMTRLRSMSFWL